MSHKKQNKTDEIENKERREVLTALVKYSAAVGAASTVTLSASEAVAHSAASGYAHNPDKKKDAYKKWKKYKQENPRHAGFLANLFRLFSRLI